MSFRYFVVRYVARHVGFLRVGVSAAGGGGWAAGGEARAPARCRPRRRRRRAPERDMAKRWLVSRAEADNALLST